MNTLVAVALSLAFLVLGAGLGIGASILFLVERVKRPHDLNDTYVTTLRVFAVCALVLILALCAISVHLIVWRRRRNAEVISTVDEGATQDREMQTYRVTPPAEDKEKPAPSAWKTAVPEHTQEGL